ncbi:hypothetical protein D8770_27955, partial [Methylobacterium sp. DB1607]|nr:hypothetical protein [Methylobacterium sp. DB1607]
AWKKDWDGAREGVSKFEGVLRGVTPVLSGLGVAGIGVGLSIAGAASAIGEFSSKTRGLSQAAKDIGLTIDQLRTFNALGERFGVTADTMTSAAKSFAGSMFEIKRQGSTFIELQAMNLGKLAEDLASSKNMEQAIQRGMEGLRKIPDAEVRRRVSRLLFGTDDVGLIASNVTGTVAGTMKEVSAAIGKMDKDTEEAAKNFQKHMNHISEAAERAKLKFIGPLLEGMVGVIDDIENAAKNPEAAKLKMLRDSRADADKAALSAPWPLKGYFERQRDSIDAEIRKLEDATRKGTRDGLKDALREQQNGGATFQQQSYGGGPAGGGSLIHKAAWGGFGGGGGPLGGAPGGYGHGSGPVSGAGLGPGPLGERSGGPLGGVPSPAPSGPRGGAVPSGADAVSGGSAPRGNGRGNPRAARTSDMMAWAMDQLRREGVPEQHLRQSAAHLVGQATMESGLDPNKVHDHGTGYGIYGARDPKGWGNYRGARRSQMVRWLEANGYARNSAEGQMRYMAREAMLGGYGKTRRILMGQGTGDVDTDTNTITREFESPAVINRRSGAVRNAYRAGPSDGAVRADVPGAGSDQEVPWHQRPRSNEPGKMSRLRDDEIDVRGSGERPGDRMMRRFYGESAPVARGGKGSLYITLDGFPPGAKARASMDDLFKDTKVERSRSQMDMI